jgi:hypothetical protein
MGSGSGAGRINSRIFTNSFAGKEREMAFPLMPKLYFGFQTKPQYSYNVYHQLADNSAGFGSRGAKWALRNGIHTSYVPPAPIVR